MSIVAQSRKWLEKALKPALNALLPASCLLCGEHCGQGMLCPDCLADLPRLGANACPRCAE
ncbi:MAG TPA: double zinc ribbon domain-containing protein, partial [Azospira sp.]|nr:double zinc ribbon domain-containing protein [Azospira sp.]